MAKKSKKRALGEYGPPGEIKYRPPVEGNQRSALERAAGLAPDLSDCGVQLRAHGTVYPCVAQYDGETLQLTLTEPARGIAAGQTAVLYDGDTVLGSATITATRVPVSS